MFREELWHRVVWVAVGIVVAVFVVLVLMPRQDFPAAPGASVASSSPLAESAYASPEPTFVPVRSEPPASAQEAINHAKELARKYYAARSYFHAHPDKPEALHVYAQGPQAEVDLELAGFIQEHGVQLSGAYAFEPDADAAYAQDLSERSGEVETSTPFGTVILPGCQDGTDLDGTNASGGTYTPIGLERYRVVLTILYVVAEGRWILYDINHEGEERAAC